MLRRKLASFSSLLKNPKTNSSIPKSSQRIPRSFRFSSASAEQIGARKSTFRRRAIPVVLLSLAGGVALSALNDLAIFHVCSSKAIEKASKNQKIIETLGEPIVRGPWYDATVAIGHRRSTVSCTFPVFGPQGSGIFQLKAIRTGEDGLFSFLRHHDWDIVLMEALLHVPIEDEKNQTFRVILTDDTCGDGFAECNECRSPMGASEK